MKVTDLQRSHASTIAFAVIVFCLSLNHLAAQKKTLFPLKVGNTYHVEFLGTAGDFTLVTSPSPNGWAVVNIEDGFRGASVKSSKNIGVNITLAILIEDVTDALKAQKEQYVRAFEAAQSVQSNKDAMINDLNNIAASAVQYRIRSISAGGGGGLYTGYSIPSNMAKNKNATYVATPSVNTVSIVATSQLNTQNTISVTLDGNGMLTNWKYGGNFR